MTHSVILMVIIIPVISVSHRVMAQANQLDQQQNIYLKNFRIIII